MSTESQLKVCLLGCPSVGKSSITQQVVHGRFPHNYNPTIEDTYVAEITHKNAVCKFRITDTMGYESTSIPENHMIGKHAFIVVFDISDRRSFETTKNICDELLDSISYDITTYPIVMVGNKLDLLSDHCAHLEKKPTIEQKRQMEQTRREAENFASDRKLTKYIEISAMNNQQVIGIFQSLVPLIIDANDDLQQFYPNLRPQVNETNISAPINQNLPAQEVNPAVSGGWRKNPECRVQ